MQSGPDAPAARYDDDYYEWTRAQAGAIRAGRWADVDVENLAEEVDSLGRSNATEIRSRLRVLLMHLLKLQYQPERATPSWENTVRTQGFEINAILDASPSLRRQLGDLTRIAYAQARKQAAGETGLPVDRFPAEMTPELDTRLQAVLVETTSTP